MSQFAFSQATPFAAALSYYCFRPPLLKVLTDHPPKLGTPLPGQIGTSHLLRNYYSPGPLPGSVVLCTCPLLQGTSMLLVLGCRCPPRQAHRCLWWVPYPPWSCHTPFSPASPLSVLGLLLPPRSASLTFTSCVPSPQLSLHSPHQPLVSCVRLSSPWAAVKCYTQSSLGPGPCGSAFHP